jgi:hypothetical protein
MTAKQRSQLQGIENVLSAMVAELQPRVIMPDASKQKALGIADETMLVPVGNRRAITANATPKGGWAIQEFDTSSGELVPIWKEDGELTDELVIAVVLGAAVGSLQEQIELGGDDAVMLSGVHAILTARHSQLIDQGLESFEFEADEPAAELVEG